MGFRVQGSGFRVQLTNQTSRILCRRLGFRIQGPGFRVQGPRFRIQSRLVQSRCRDQFSRIIKTSPVALPTIKNSPDALPIKTVASLTFGSQFRFPRQLDLAWGHAWSDLVWAARPPPPPLPNPALLYRHSGTRFQVSGIIALKVEPTLQK